MCNKDSLSFVLHLQAMHTFLNIFNKTSLVPNIFLVLLIHFKFNFYNQGNNDQRRSGQSRAVYFDENVDYRFVPIIEFNYPLSFVVTWLENFRQRLKVKLVLPHFVNTLKWKIPVRVDRLTSFIQLVWSTRCSQHLSE